MQVYILNYGAYSEQITLIKGADSQFMDKSKQLEVA